MTRDKTVTAMLAAMEREDGINLHEYPIKIINSSGAIRLEGEVENIIAKRKAFMIANRVACDLLVEDRLRLHAGERREGKALLNAALSTLMQEPAFAELAIHADGDGALSHVNGSGWIAVSADGSVLQLRGEVGSLSHRRLAEVLAWWVPGCCDVRNHLHVQPAELETDDEISDAVRIVFDKESSLNPDEIMIMTRNGEVTLRGVVHSDEQKRIASYDCWYIPGVHAVHNELQVHPG